MYIDMMFAWSIWIPTPCSTPFEGWAAAGSSRGGKPFFLGRMDPAEHCIFFDDHITPLDPKIVDTWVQTIS